MTDWLLVAVSPEDPWTVFARGCADHIASVCEPTPSLLLLDEAATRSNFHDSVAEGLGGIVLAGHGTPGAFLGSDGSILLDPSSAYLSGGRWVYALACDIALELGGACRAAGGWFVGYRVRIGRPDAPAAAHAAAVHDIPRVIVQRLLEGARSESQSRRSVQEVIDRFFDAHPDLFTPGSGPLAKDLQNAYDWMCQLSQLQFSFPPETI